LANVEKLTVASPHEYGALISQYQSYGYSIYTPLGLEVTRLCKRKHFRSGLFFLGLLLGVLPGLIYLFVYLFKKDQYAELRLEMPANPISFQQPGWPIDLGQRLPPTSRPNPDVPRFPQTPWSGPTFGSGQTG
jgi:hypothetical protein